MLSAEPTTLATVDINAPATDETLMAEILYLTPRGEIRALELKHYPAGEPLVTCQDIPTRLLVRPKSLATLMTALFWVDALVERGYAPPDLILPCVPGARQDRLNPEGDVLFTLKSVARMINARNLPSVTVLDPHSDVTPALIERCRVISASQIVLPGNWQAVVAPDAGALKRATQVAKRIGIPVVHAWKSRDVKTGLLNGFGVEPIPPGLRLLVVDDLCDGGGTFVGLAEVLASMGAKSDLYVTHGLFTAGTDKLLKCFEQILCTDSTLDPKPGVTVIPTARPLLMHA